MAEVILHNKIPSGIDRPYRNSGLEKLDARYPKNINEISTQTLPYLQEALRKSDGNSLTVVHMGDSCIELSSPTNAPPTSKYHVPEILRQRYKSYLPMARNELRLAAEQQIPIIYLIGHYRKPEGLFYSDLNERSAINHFLFHHDESIPELLSVPMFVVGTKLNDPEPLPGYSDALGFTKHQDSTELDALGCILQELGLKKTTIIGESFGGSESVLQNKFKPASFSNGRTNDVLDYIQFGGCAGLTIETFRNSGIDITLSDATFPYSGASVVDLRSADNQSFTMSGEPEWIVPPIFR